MHLARIEPAYVAAEGWCETWNFDCSCGNVLTATKSSGGR